MRTRIQYLLCLVVLFSACCASSKVTNPLKDVSPFQFGLCEAVTGVGRYEVLLKTHKVAVATGVNVDYTDVGNIDIEIPADFKSIPLTEYNDFKGCTITVKNNQKKVGLFSAFAEEVPVSVNKELIDAGDFRSIKELANGRVLLLIEDENLWIDNRRGHDYGHQRQDILLIENGRSKNAVVMPYNNNDSKPFCKYVDCKKNPLVIKNLTIYRDTASTANAYAFDISGFDDVRITNFSINTPESTLYGDNAIRISNCTNVWLNKVYINGTYSQRDKFGYGISLRNIWNFRATNLYGTGKWGVFGSNDVNTALIEDSVINRFDIHCYGKDVSFKNVKFFGLYNQFSSVYGTVSFEGCEFRDFIPVLIETSYNAYTEFDVNMKDCVFYTTSAKNYLVNTGSLLGEVNKRRELSEKKLPIVKVVNLKVISLETGKEAKQVDVFKKRGKFIQERKINNVIKL